MATAVTTKTDSRLAARCAAIASLGAAVIHFAVTPMHGRDWLPSGVFFAALATFQLLWAVVVWFRPAAPLLASGIAVNAGAAGLWVYSCVIGPPAGPSAGQPEAVNAAGICVLLLQCYVVMGATFSWSRKYQPEQVSGFGRAFVLLGAQTVMAGAVAVGLVGSLQGHHHHHGGVTEAQGQHEATHESHMEGHPHPAGPAQAPVAPEQGQPVTDMSLHTDGDHTPPAAPPAVNPAPAQPEPADSDEPADGHSHHHDD